MNEPGWPRGACFECKGSHPISQCPIYSDLKAQNKLKGHKTTFDKAKEEHLRAKKAERGSTNAILLGQEPSEASITEKIRPPL